LSWIDIDDEPALDKAEIWWGGRMAQQENGQSA
jgi:hypothetical protein